MTELQEHIIYLQIKTKDRATKANEDILHGYTDLLSPLSNSKHIHSDSMDIFWELYSVLTARQIQTWCCTTSGSQTLHSARRALHRCSLSSQVKCSSFPAIFVIYLSIPFLSTDTTHQQQPHPLSGKKILLCSHLAQVCISLT